MHRSLARSFTLTLTCSLVLLVAASQATAATGGPGTWLAIDGSVAYQSSSRGSKEPAIYSQNLNSSHRTRIGIADGYVSSYASAASSGGIALMSNATGHDALTIFRRAGRAIAVAIVKDGECPQVDGPAFTRTVMPLDLAPDGGLTYLQRSATTGCELWLLHRSGEGQTERVWLPPDVDQLINHSTIEAKGQMVLLGHSAGNPGFPTIVFNRVSRRVVYTVAQARASYDGAHLATSGTLGLTQVGNKSGSATRVNLKTGAERRFEFPRGTEAHFCGRFTFFADGRLVKVYDELGRTRYRRSPGDFKILGGLSTCSSKYAYFGGNGTSGFESRLLSLTKFKARKL